MQKCFLAMLGDFELDSSSETPFQTATMSLLIVYVILVTILLLNLLIAMMGDTYGRIIDDADKKWRLERARAVCSIEAELSPEERDQSINKYWTVVDDQRYLQVQEVNDDHFKENEDKADDKKE